MYQKKTQLLWVSNSSIGDFLNCPRAYYLKNVYKDPITRNKISIINPSLVLGQVVHEVLEALSVLKSEERFKQPLLEIYKKKWSKFTGELGGFENEEREEEFKKRGEDMIQRVIDNPGVLLHKALRLKSTDSLPPRYMFSIDDNIILCGKIDWLEYIPEDDSVHIIDFKTGKHDEESDSLQLPIYALLVHNLQKRKTKKMSYWYLDRSNELIEVQLPDLNEAHERVLKIALQVKQLRTKALYKCRRDNGCFACKPFESIINGQGKLIGKKGYQDIYILPNILPYL